MRRLRGGELLALGGAVLLLVALFLPWFRVTPPRDDAMTTSGWNALGWLVLVIATATIAAAAWLAIANAARRRVTRAVGAGVLAVVAGTISLLVLAARALILQPGPNESIGLRHGAWLGLAGAAALAIGAWWSLADERTDLPENAYMPPPARPAPPERAS